MKSPTALVLFVSLLTIAGSENVVCHFTTWSIYRSDNGYFDVSQVNPYLCSHIIYSFVALGKDGDIILSDEWEGINENEIKNLLLLRRENPRLKVLFSIGGWNEGSANYSDVAGNSTLRNHLVNNVMLFLDEYPFDGVDLDWEYPGKRGGKEEDVENFVSLLSELKSALKAKSKLLTVAAACGIASSDTSYNYQGVANNVDMINLMCYDFHGSFEPYVGHYAPLNASHLDQTSKQKELNVVAGVLHWLSKGVEPQKLNLGLGTYGRGFVLENQNNASLYSPIKGGNKQGPYTQEEGIIIYNEICELYSNWQRIWDDEQKVPHIVNGDQWIGYDDPESLAYKVRFARDSQLGGLMVSALDTDDFRGICGDGRYPILNAIRRAWNS